MTDTNQPKVQDGRKKNGGARPGAGRKPGVKNRISAERLLEAVFNATGQPFEVTLAQGYNDTITDGDRATRVKYENMILNKIVADKAEVDVTTLGTSLNDRRSAFQAIVDKLRQNKDQDDATNEVNE